MVNVFTEAYTEAWCATTHISSKAMLLHQNNWGASWIRPTISIREKLLQNIDHISHLGSHLSSKVNIDEDIKQQLSYG